MTDIKKRTTVIHEDTRQALGISRDEYALCAYLNYRAADPRQRVEGWCCDNKDSIAEFVGVTRMGLYKMMNRMESIGLIETNGSGEKRATAKWVDSEQTASERKQSLQGDVNKVYTERKQSLHNGVNKVYETNKVYRKSIRKKEEEVKTQRVSTTTAEKNPVPVEAEKEKSPTPIPPPPSPAAGSFARVDVAAEVERLRADELARETFARNRRIPQELYDKYLGEFAVEVSATQESHYNVASFRRHFFNWSEKHYRIAKERAANSTTTQQRPGVRAGT